MPTYHPPLLLYKAHPICTNISQTQIHPFSSPQPPEKTLGDMDPGEVVDEEEEVPRGARRREARRRERRQLVERILAAHNRKDIEQFLEAFPPGSNPSDDDIIYWARRRANLHPFQCTRLRWSRILYPDE